MQGKYEQVITHFDEQYLALFYVRDFSFEFDIPFAGYSVQCFVQILNLTHTDSRILLMRP